MTMNRGMPDFAARAGEILGGFGVPGAPAYTSGALEAETPISGEVIGRVGHRLAPAR